MAVFASRQIVTSATPIVVTITGSGDAYYCYAIINGTKQYEAGTHEVNAGDTITFGLRGGDDEASSLVINGALVLIAPPSQNKTYDLTVPSGVSSIKISMLFSGGFSGNQIIVTTS